MLFLDEFKDNFNIIVDVYRPVITKNSIWEEEKNFVLHLSWITGILSLRRPRYEQYTENQVEYIKTTHSFRTYIYDIKEKDKIIDQDWTEYNVVFVYKISDIDWTPDHLLVLLNKIK